MELFGDIQYNSVGVAPGGWQRGGPGMATGGPGMATGGGHSAVAMAFHAIAPVPGGGRIDRDVAIPSLLLNRSVRC